MRYITNDSGYIEAVSFNYQVECNNKLCTEYTGAIPTGYESLVDWNENANINAYKIVDGNLTYDSTEDARLQTLWKNQLIVSNGETITNNYSTTEQVIGTWIDGKPLYRKTIIVDDINIENPMDIDNVDVVFLNEGCSYVTWGSGYSYPTSIGNFALSTQNGTILARNAELAGWDGFLTVEYTKTTD